MSPDSHFDHRRWRTLGVRRRRRLSQTGPKVCLFLSQCKCWPGFHLKDDGKTCVDVDECAATLPCSQRCINTYGSFKCLCVDGYEALERSPNTCKALSGQPGAHAAISNLAFGYGTKTASHFSRRAFSHHGGPPRDPKTERRRLKLHDLEAGLWN